MFQNSDGRTSIPNDKLNLSAKSVLVNWQKAFILIVISLIICCSLRSCDLTIFYLVIIFNSLFLLSNSYRFIIILLGANINITHNNRDNDQTIRNELPQYTILVPLFKEANVIPSLIRALNSLIYPISKLQILLIIEEEDDETLQAINHLQLNTHYQIIIVPYSYPQTKSKACNYALQFAEGELTCIYDADDRPNPNQLLMVVNEFNKSNSKVVCIQCRLNYYNAQESLLTSLFEIEYQLLFNYILLAAAHFKLPIPLGGSSNHFKTSFLNDIGGWDPFNVTEDADLGLRLAIYGFDTKVISSITQEEAPIKIKPWIKQRTRWLKGYFHTFLIYFRKPHVVIKKFKLSGALFFIYIMLLGPILSLGSSIILILSVYLYIGDSINLPQHLITFLKIFTNINMLFTILNFSFSSYIIGKLKGHRYLKFKWMFFIFYFLLHVFASILAVYKLIKEPHKWDKTSHGITNIKN